LVKLTASGQTTGGSLTGRVTDSTGAAAAGVEITARNEATNRPYLAVSSNAGTYVFPDLDPGRYSINAKGGGAVSGVVIEVATRYVLDLKVQGEGGRAFNSLLEGATSEIGTYIQPKFFQDAPLFVNGRYRNPETFVQYLPGVNNGAVESSILGGPIRSKEILLGWQRVVNPDSRGCITATPAVQSIRE